MRIVNNKNNIIIFLVFIVVLCFFSIKSISAKFEQGYTTDDNVVDYNFDLEFNIDSYSEKNNDNILEEYEIIDVKANSYSVFNIDVKNVNSGVVYYGIWYKNLSDIYTNIEVGKYISFANDTFGSLNSGETKTTTIVIKNNESNNIKVKIGVASSDKSTNDIGYYDGRTLIEGIISNLNNDNINEPILSGNMIPVVYDEDKHYWVKADYLNKNNNWYDYNKKRWANVILVKDSVSDKYAKDLVGTQININDVMAFYVWIPRFKYLLWDINRQANSYDDYAYNANNNGISIMFERDGESSSNVTCNYNYSSSLKLFDECMYSSNKVSNDTKNSVYADAWYTHPAFKRGNEELSGFWIGKFETSGSKDNPTIIPDSKSLIDLPIADYYKVSKTFGSYGIGNLKSSMIRNVEWGAVSYLTHSVYGLCDDNYCRDIYINNSIDYYTGRSSGSYIDDDINQYGTYSYDGYGIINGVKNNNYTYGVVASTTGNVSGVYDMAGGALEYVMANISNSELNINIGDNSGNWDNKIDQNDYDLYSPINNINNFYDRSRLGDATSEVSIGDLTWGNRIKTEINDDSIWMIRGLGNNIYGFGFADGGASDIYSFRSIIY